MEFRIMKNGKLRIDHVKGNEIKFRHFSGEKDKYHKVGDRDFNISLSDEIAEELIVNGWRVKSGKEYVNADGEQKRYDSMIKVIVKYHENNDGSFRGPSITRYTELGSVDLDIDLVTKDLDRDQIEDACFILNPYLSDFDGKYTPYLETMAYKIEENPFNGMY